MKNIILITILFFLTTGFSQSDGNMTEKEMIKRFETLMPKISEMNGKMESSFSAGLKMCSTELKRTFVMIEMIEARAGVMWYMTNLIIISVLILFYFQQRRMNADLEYWIEKSGNLASKLNNEGLLTTARPKKGLKISLYIILPVGLFLFNFISLFL